MNSRWILGILLIFCVQTILSESLKSVRSRRRSIGQDRDLNDEAKVSSIVDDVCSRMLILSHESTKASWNYATNLTIENQKVNQKHQENFANFLKDASKELSVIDYSNFKNETLKRLLKGLSKIGDAKLDESLFKKLTAAINDMQETYSMVKIPSYEDKSRTVTLEPEITQVFSTSTDPEKLKYYWLQWYNAAGTPSKQNFFEYVKLKNVAARLNGLYI